MDSGEAFRGFGIYNRRGIVSKSLREGGEQERELAKRYAEHSEAIKYEWPATATALRKVASGYTDEARSGDDDAMLN